MSKIELLHGSDHVIEKPDFHLGKTNNDYGRGFYCTRELSMAMEWACKQNTESFVQNGLPLRTLNQALRLGKLGEQTVLISEKAFENLKFEGVELADKTIYYPKFINRDLGARETYRNEIRKGRSYKDDIFVLDILREEMKNDDLRIQRILFE